MSFLSLDLMLIFNSLRSRPGTTYSILKQIKNILRMSGHLCLHYRKSQGRWTHTDHLFSCPSNPTDLDVKSLWTDPRTAATFLGLPGDLDDND